MMNGLNQWQWVLLTAPLMGVLLTAAFAPCDHSYASLPALMFLYHTWAHGSAKRAFCVGYVFGLGLFGAGIWWVYISIHDFGGAGPLSAGLLTFLLVGLWALFPGVTGALTAKFCKSPLVWLRILPAGLIWVVVEYFRGDWLLNGFPWLQIAYSQLNTPLAGYAPLAGVYGTGFLLAVSAFAGVEMLEQQLSLRKGLLFLLLVWGVGFGLKGQQWTQVVGEPIKITLIQGNISQDRKWSADERLNTLKLYQHLTEQHWDSQVIIWPETAVPAFLSQVKTSYLDPLSASARQHHTDLVVSLPSSGEGDAYYNSVLSLGEQSALYHKTHLLPFGEYLPLQPLSGWVLDLINIPLGDFTPGAERQTLLTAGGYPFVTTICYEDAFAEQINRQMADAAYIVNVTNDAWFGNTSEPYQHMQMAQMRALEAGRYLVRATNTGLTGFIGPDGVIFNQAPLFTTTTLTDYIKPMSGTTPYAIYGDKAVFLLLIVLVMVLFCRWQWLKDR